MLPNDKPELLTMSIQMNIPYRWKAGRYVSAFLREIRDNAKIWANKCPQCGRVLLPPRIACGRCNVRTGDWIEMSDRGTVVSYMVNRQSFLDPTTGHPRPVPNTVGTIQLDGAPAVILHFLEEKDPQKLHLGMRVQAVFKPREERIGHILDILHFKTISD